MVARAMALIPLTTSRVVPPEDRPYWAAWAALGLAPMEALAIARAFPRLETAWQADPAALAAAGVPPATAARVTAARRTIAPDDLMQGAAAAGINLCTLLDADYPALLRQIPDPPIVLFYRGSMSALAPAVAVVGTRRPTDYGRQVAAQLSRDLAAAGVTIVSGLALGIDSCAHQAALQASGCTVAVLGGGVDTATLYPPSNAGLAAAIVHAGGAVLAEYPPGTPSLPYRFPLRNRIIAGCCLATIVVEAPVKSGALITARAAVDYNREVLAVPGRITEPNAEGPNGLIANGAALIRTASDVAAVLGLPWTKRATPPPPNDAPGAAVLDCLTEPLTFNELQRLAGLGAAATAAAVTRLEVQGHVRRLPSGKYYRTP